MVDTDLHLLADPRLASLGQLGEHRRPDLGVVAHQDVGCRQHDIRCRFGVRPDDELRLPDRAAVDDAGTATVYDGVRAEIQAPRGDEPVAVRRHDDLDGARHRGRSVAGSIADIVVEDIDASHLMIDEAGDANLVGQVPVAGVDRLDTWIGERRTDLDVGRIPA